MHLSRPSIISWIILVSVGLALVLAEPAPIAHAAVTVRYAKPSATGTGSCLTWANACTLQTALANSVSGDEIWVAKGIHKPTSGTDPNLTFQLKSGVAVYGGFAMTETLRSQRNFVANVTVLSGDIDNNDAADAQGVVTNVANIYGTNSYHVVTGANGATLDGVTITAGYAASGAGCPGRCGGGMYDSASNPTLANVTFSGNQADNRGGAMYNLNSSPTLTNVTFTSNSAKYFEGGGMYNSSSNPALTNVTFSGNLAATYGGGMYNLSASPTLTNVTFSNNQATGAGAGGGGMYNSSSNPALTNVTFSGNLAAAYGGGMNNLSASPTFTNTTFSGNQADVGGGMYNQNSSSPTLTNVTFSGNQARIGGGIYNDASSPTLTNVTFGGNIATLSMVGGGGGGMYNSSSNPQVRNTILWGETGGEIVNGSGTTITSTIVQGGCPSGSTCTNIITADPLLASLGNYGGSTQTFALLPGSSAIKATTTNCPSTDQRGIARSSLPTCDIGAFESRGFTLGSLSGNNQSATINTAFANPLSLTVTAINASEPVTGGKVTFTPPGSGAGANITGSPATIAANGTVSATATANSMVGSYTITATAAGVGTSAQFVLTNLDVIINGLNAANDSPTLLGNTTHLTATMSAGSNVTFQWNYGDGTALGNGATTSHTYASVGSYTAIVTATNSRSSTSTTTPVTITQVTTTTLTSSPNPSTYGQAVTFTATVTSAVGLPTGTATFYDNGSPIGNGTLNANGQLMMTTSSLIVGSHSITATYGGDVTHAASTSSVLTQIVNKVATTTTLTSSGSPSSYGQPVTFTATVTTTVGTPSGTATFYDNGLNIGSGPLNASGQATMTTSSLAVGTHPSMTATYNGDATHATSTSGSYSQIVIPRYWIIRVSPNGTTTWPCGGTWAGACSLQTALANALSGDEIWGGTGVYTPTTSATNRTATFQLKSGVAVYGGFAMTETLRSQRDLVANVTVLSGDIDHNDTTDAQGVVTTTLNLTGTNSCHVVQGANGATLDGVAVTAGNANVTCTGYLYEYGGGMLNSSSSPTLTNVTFSGNSASRSGGGMYNYSSSPTLTNVTFSGNSASLAGGGMGNQDSSPLLTNVTFNGNSAASFGGGIFNFTSGNMIIRNSILWGDTRGEIVNNNGSITLTVINSVVQGGCPAGSPCTNIITADPFLSPLGNYGGSPQTIPLLSRSSAIDAADPADCPATDQRGQARDDLHCDIGAYELQHLDSPTVIRSTSSVTMTTFGPALVGIQRDAGLTNPGIITVTKETWSRQGPESIGVVWNLTPTVTSGFSLTLQLCYTNAELGSLTENNLRFWSSDGITWTMNTIAPTFAMINGYHCATLSGLAHLSRWTLATAEPTVVTMRDFTAQANAPILLRLLPVLFVAVGGFALMRRKRITQH